MISDYAVIIAILVFATIDNAFHLQTPKLLVPVEFKVIFMNRNYWKSNSQFDWKFAIVIHNVFFTAHTSRPKMVDTIHASKPEMVYVHSSSITFTITDYTSVYGSTDNIRYCK